MKRLIYILALISAVSANAQFYVDGAIVHNNGSILYVEPDATNNGGTINNLGNTHFVGNYNQLNAALITNQLVTDTIFAEGNFDVSVGLYDGANINGNGYQGALVFNSPDAQVYTGSTAPTNSRSVYNLVLDNTGTKTINNYLIATNSIRFNNGVAITSSADTFGLISDGIVYGTPGVNSHVSGPFYREGHSAVADLFYPIGDGVNYRPMWFKSLPVGAPTAVFGVEAVNGATGGTGGFDVDNLIDTRHWHVEHITGDYQGAQIELSYDAVEGVTNQNMLIVAQADAPGGKYRSLDQSATTGNATAGTVVSEYNGGQSNYMIGQSALMRVRLSAYLEGAFSGGSMFDSLYSGAYGDLLTPHFANGNAGANKYGIDMLNNYGVPSGGVQPVDVVVLTLRDGNNPAAGDLDSSYAWLMNDGTIRDFSAGIAPFATFSNTSLTPGANYTVVVHHRNHVPLMYSTGSAPYGLVVNQSTSTPAFFDVTNTGNIYGIGFKDLGGVAGLYIGNADQQYTPLEVNALDLWLVGNDAQNNLPNNDLIDTDVTLSGETNQTDWEKTKWANDQLYYSTIP